MHSRIRLFSLTVLTCLALAPSASAHRWHDPSGTPDTQYADPWNGSGDWDGSGWNHDQSQPQEAPAWNPNQGQPQETPTNWNQSPPVKAPQRDRNPWNDIPPLPVSKTPTVAGKTAMIRRNGLAALPKGAPARVRAIISAANRIIGKPYKWGGGHGRLFDSGYDCSGTVSYALIRAGLLGYPMVSGSLARWGAKGKGRYVTVYANKGHVYMEVAGLRLDTSSVGDRGGKSGVRWRPLIGRRVGFAVRHVRGL